MPNNRTVGQTFAPSAGTQRKAGRVFALLRQAPRHHRRVGAGGLILENHHGTSRDGLRNTPLVGVGLATKQGPRRQGINPDKARA